LDPATARRRAGKPSQAGQQLRNAAIHAEQGHGLQAAMLDHEVRVIVQVLADGRQLA
jgi:hypothetical protein